MMKRASWKEYQKQIAEDNYYYGRSCIRQNFFPGSEKLFIDMLHNDLGKDLLDDPMHSSCTGIGYHSDIVPLETIMTVVARQFALMTEAGYENFVTPRPRKKPGKTCLKPRGASSASPRAWRIPRMSFSISASRSPPGQGINW